jgi:hypothetical protein
MSDEIQVRANDAPPNVYPKIVNPQTFSIQVPGFICTAWYDGLHRVSDRKCRCGARFVLFQTAPDSAEHDRERDANISAANMASTAI